MGKVGIIVLNWNRPKDTIECLESLIPFVKARQASIVVCDNASTDDSEGRILEWAGHYFRIDKGVDCARSKESDFIVIQTGENRGYADGNNAGIRYVLAHGGFEFIWILNNDTVVDKNALNALCQYACEHPEVMVFGSTLVDYNCRQRVQSAGGYRYFPLLTLIHAIYGGKDLSYVMEQSEDVLLDCVSGAALFARIELFQDLGLLNEDFFLYYEELDLATRMKQRNYRARWCKNSLVYHKGAVSTGGGTAIDPKGSWLANYHENLSTLKYTAAYHPRLLFLVAVFRFIAKSIVYILRRQAYLFTALIKAYAAFFMSSKVYCHEQPNKKGSRVIALARVRP